MITAGAILWLTAGVLWILPGNVQFADASLAAVIAAVSSLINGFILLRARKVQDDIKREVKIISNDTAIRGEQIMELRSLSIERNRQIGKLERLADRFDSYNLVEIEEKVDSINRKVSHLTPIPWDGVDRRESE